MMSDDAPKVGSNTVHGAQLRAFIERVERLREEKREIADAEKSVYAEAKANGFAPKYMRALVKLRALKPSEREEDEAMMDLYLSAVGMAREAPLFRAVGQLGVDLAARESIVEALKLLAPMSGEFVVKMGGAPIRVWRDDEGEARAEEIDDRPATKPMPAASERPAATKAPPPACTEDEAEALGRKAAKEDQPIIANPFPWDDRRRPRWDLGWRREAGSDGMGPEDPGAGK